MLTGNLILRAILGLGISGCVITALIMTHSLWSFMGLLFLLPLIHQCDCIEIDEVEVKNDN